MISERIRKIENLHIVFWLIKDTCWCLDFKRFGMIMIVPTILVALWIAIKTRKSKSEFAHNLAVLFWISANSTWMFGEFYVNDGTRPYAIVLFVLGLISIGQYYVLALLNRSKAK